MADILIAAPTHEKHAAHIKEWADRCHAQSVPCDLMLVDMSNDAEFSETLATLDADVRKITTMSPARIIKARKLIMEEFLHGTWTHLFFVDTDILIEKDAAKRLRSHDEHIVSAVYLTPLNIGGKPTILPEAYGFSKEKDYRIPIPTAGLFTPALIEIHSASLGCCMLSREVVENIPLRMKAGPEADADIFFCMDAREKGYLVFLDTSTWASHRCWPPGDERNEYLTKTWNVEQNKKVLAARGIKQ